MEKFNLENFNLENLDKKHPFKVPNGYFDDLSERIHQRILDNSNNSLNDNVDNNVESDLLKNFDKKTPFGTPEQYFEDFSEKLNQKIKLQDNQKNNQQKIKIHTPKPFYAGFSAQMRTYTKALAIAASLVFVVGFAYMIYENNQPKNTENLLAFNHISKDISNNEIVEYLQENHTESNENYILEHISENHLTETHLAELNISNEIPKDILIEIPKETLNENKNLQEKNNQNNNLIINDLPKEEIEEMKDNGELEEEF